MKRKRRVLFVGALAAVIVVVLLRQGRGPSGTRVDPKVAAKVRLEEVRGEGLDLTDGPCLGRIAPDWVADVVHDPRLPVDEKPEHQCAEYRSGKATHFVELTAEGAIVRVR